MSRTLWRTLSLTIVTAIVLGGSSVRGSAKGAAGVQQGSATELTNFHYLPAVPFFTPVWFEKSPESPYYLQNFANDAGCNWLGVAGDVWDLQVSPAPYGAYHVHVWGNGIDARAIVGDAPAYGPAGYEQVLFDAPVIRDYYLQLEMADGRNISPVYEVQTRASCNQNLLIFNFMQER